MEKKILIPFMSLMFCTIAGADAAEGSDRNHSIALQTTGIDENKPVAQAKDSCHLDEMNFYAKIFGGANFLQNTTVYGNKSSYQTGYVFSGSFGYSWRRYGLRFEAEYAFRRNAIKKIQFITQGVSKHGHFQTSSYMANLLWDLPLCSWGCSFWKIEPFIGAGLGYDFKKVHSSNSRIVYHQNLNHISWQVMAGLAYPIFRNAELSLEYKFHQGGCHFDNHSIGLGFMYKFGFLK
ncbi:MAG: porin family protein [Rhabdochlamydiaceae bacterium]|nr:porin family protein [Rhabdochlamydiaceae bacterium]